MKMPDVNQSIITKSLWVALLSLSMNVAHATFIYSYTSKPITTIEHVEFNPAGTFTQIINVSAGNTIAASITLNSLLPANTATNLSTSDFLGFSVGSHLFDSLGDRSQQEFYRNESNGNITTDADGNIVDWDLTFEFSGENREEGGIVFHATNTLSSETVIPMTVDGVTFNSFDSFGNLIPPHNFYSFDVYDSFSIRRGDTAEGIEEVSYTSRTGAAEVSQWQVQQVDSPTPMWLIALGSLGLLSTYTRANSTKARI